MGLSWNIEDSLSEIWFTKQTVYLFLKIYQAVSRGTMPFVNHWEPATYAPRAERPSSLYSPGSVQESSPGKNVFFSELSIIDLFPNWNRRRETRRQRLNIFTNFYLLHLLAALLVDGRRSVHRIDFTITRKALRRKSASRNIFHLQKIVQ